MRRGGLAIGCVSAEVSACCALAPRQLLPRADSSAKPPCRAVRITRWRREQRSNEGAALYLDPRPVRRDADERLRQPVRQDDVSLNALGHRQSVRGAVEGRGRA